MARKLVLAVLFASVLFAGCRTGQGQAATCADEGWIRLFDGESLKGWKASENKDTFTTRDGMIVAQGPRSHLFYAGPLENANFTNFEFKADVMTEPGSNSGMYFHTEYQETGWPSKGYEVQVNNTHKDPKKTGGLYAVKDVFDAPAKDNEWFNQHIIVQGKNITIKVNGKTMVEYTEPEEVGRSDAGRKISSGTFALQGHDPKSIAYYKNIMVKPLPCGPKAKPKEKPQAKEQPKAPIKIVVVTGGHRFEHEPFFSVFKGHDDIKYVEALQKDHSELFEDISKWDYDVIVLYNMTQKISPQRKKNFGTLLNRGVGLVVLHHAMGAFQSWPEYKKISGGKYYTKATEEGGVKRPGSTFKHDEDMKIHIANSKHPITRGMSDFEIHDETYKNCGHQKNNQVLLTTDHPNSDKTIGWVRRYGKAKVCGIQLGHDGKAYANPNYRRLVAQAIRWTAGRLN